MLHAYCLHPGRLTAGTALLALAGALATPAAAQSTVKPTWVTAAVGTSNSAALPSQVRATATDASGNVVVVGSFTGTFTLGGTTLTPAGNSDVFVAKYLTATDTWAWAVRAGGIGADEARSVAVRGTSIYVAGYLQNDRSNAQGVSFGAQPQYGASTTISFDGFVAKLTDAGSSASFVWSQVLGGTGPDYANGVAVSSLDASVYVTGSQFNDRADAQAVRYGGSGLAAGAAAQPGAAVGTPSDDLFLAKYTDQGAGATLGWTQLAGGSEGDYGYGVAVSGSRVYVAGSLANSRVNSFGVGFGYAGAGAATAVQYGASVAASLDAALARYTDNGATATFDWSQVAGGTGPDQALGVAASGNSLYVTGFATNNQADANAVRFGGTGSTPGSVALPGASPSAGNDLFVARYTDTGINAAVAWTQVGGGTQQDVGRAVAVAGNRVYVTGFVSNNAANASAVLFGGSTGGPGTATQAGASATTGNDVLAAGYIDNGASATLAWTQVGGGTGSDQGQGVAVVGTRLYVGGFTVPPATFGPLTVSAPANATVSLLGALNLTATLAATPGAALPALSLYPNPASGAAVLRGAAPATAGQVVDRLGRAVATFGTDADGTAALPAGLAPGLYLVRVGAATARWVVR